MKILLTGLPGTGKTTLLLKLLPQINSAFWVVSEEIIEEGQRVGFRAKTSNELNGIFAHKSSIESLEQIGSYKVDIATVDKLFSDPIAGHAVDDGFIVIDEIGRIQMLSPKFKQAIQELFDKDFNILATIRHGDEWTKKFTNQSDVITFTLTPDNRGDVMKNIEIILDSARAINELPAKQKAEVYRMTKEYLANDKLLQVRKLFKNAIQYFAGNKVHRIDNNKYQVHSNHGEHTVQVESGEWLCDCDLANGRGQYAGKQSECSHIQAAKLLNV